MLLVSAVAALCAVAAASATVTFDASSGTGFVGKGDVQTALGFNNAQMQASASLLVFTYSAPATQALSQSGGQAGEQAGLEMLTCIDERGRSIFTRQGTRDGSRDGTRNGTRTGAQSGTVSSTVLYEARSSKQVTGFNLTGFTGDPAFSASGTPSWDAWSWGSWSWGSWSWGDWEVSEGSSPGTNEATLANCLANGAAYDEVVDETTEGTTTPGTISAGTVVTGSVTPSGAETLYVNGVSLGA